MKRNKSKLHHAEINTFDNHQLDKGKRNDIRKIEQSKDNRVLMLDTREFIAAYMQLKTNIGRIGGTR